MDNHPIYTSAGDAMLGGWAMPFPEGDWKQYQNRPLLALTLRDAEPYIEVWDTGKKVTAVPRGT